MGVGWERRECRSRVEQRLAPKSWGIACVEELDEVRPVDRVPLGDEEDVEPAAGLDGVCVGRQNLDVVRGIRGSHRFKRLRDEGELEHESALLEEGG
jgi:hypothetical protein